MMFDGSEAGRALCINSVLPAQGDCCVHWCIVFQADAYISLPGYLWKEAQILRYT